MLAGLRVLGEDHFLRAVILQIMLHNVALGALSIIVVVGAQQRGVAGLSIGVIVASQAVGAIIGSFSTMFLVRRVAAGTVILLTGWMWVALIPLVIVLTNVIALSMLLAFLWIFVPVQRTVLGTYRAQRLPLSMLGKVVSASTLLTGALAAVGPGLGGTLLDRHNVVVTIGCLVAITMIPMIFSTFINRIGRITLSVDEK